MIKWYGANRSSSSASDCMRAARRCLLPEIGETSTHDPARRHPWLTDRGRSLLENPPAVPTGLERVDWPNLYASHKNAAADRVRVLEQVTALNEGPHETH